MGNLKKKSHSRDRENRKKSFSYLVKKMRVLQERLDRVLQKQNEGKRNEDWLKDKGKIAENVFFFEGTMPDDSSGCLSLNVRD